MDLDYKVIVFKFIKTTNLIQLLRSVQKLVILNLARILIFLQISVALVRVIGSAILGLPVKGANLRPGKLKKFPWLNIKEIRRFFITILKVIGVKGKDYTLLLSLIPLIQEQWKNSGVIWISKYWAEVFRYTISYLNGLSLVDKKLWVKRTRKGLPTILPIEIRNLVVKFKHSNAEIQRELSTLVKALLSCMNFYRAVSGHHTVKLDSITKPHGGSVRTFDRDILIRALKRLNVNKVFKLRSPRYFLPSKSGVNANLVFVSVGFDFIALMLNPTVYIGHVQWCLHYKYYFHLFLIFLLSILLYPLALIIFIINFFIDERDQLHLGKLATVREARQKARVVGITDWWTQVLFKPLHDHLSDVLKGTPEDGTFDQHRPVTNMLSLHKSKAPIVSSDLSAATDRLPVEIQADILSAMGIPGDLWKSILTRPYFVQDPSPQMVSYEVGQPMGVYSSFAMLALTNHVLNMIAVEMTEYSLSQTVPANLYSVLGDDQASRSGDQAKAYVSLLTLLGVEVNPIKGFTGRICEFAKRLYFQLDDLSFLDISPLGAKVVLRASRNPYYATALLSDMITKSYSLQYVVSLLSNYLSALFPRGKTPTEMCVLQLMYLLVLLGPQSGLYDLSRNISSVTPQGIIIAEFERLLTTFGLSPSSYFEFFSSKALDRWARPNDLLVVANTFVSDLWKVNLNSGDYFFKADYLLSDRTGMLVYAQVLMTTLLASIVSYPIMVTKLCREYMNFLILEFSTRNTLTQSDGNQLDIIKSVTKRLSPQSFKGLDILDDIDMTMFGRIPFLVLAKPINVILTKVTAVDVLDQMPAHKVSIAFIKETKPDLYKSLLNYIKRAKARRKEEKRAKFK